MNSSKELHSTTSKIFQHLNAFSFIFLSIHILYVIGINFDDSNDDVESEIKDNEDIDEIEMIKSCATTSLNKKKHKRSSIMKKNKSDGFISKRHRPNNPNESDHIDLGHLDVSQLINHVKELNETRKYILKQNKQIMLKQDHLEESLELISKN